MEFSDIQRYWHQRAQADRSAQATTNDIYLREIEVNVVGDAIAQLHPATVQDIGCGDGRTTIRLAQRFPQIQFLGFDYAAAMVETAKSVASKAGMQNVSFRIGDVTKGVEAHGVDFFFSTRCLINLPTLELQKTALGHIFAALTPGGHYLMIENFVEGHRRFNELRRQFGLGEIAVRKHNLFFERSRLGELTAEYGRIVKEENISSLYYVVSRVIYSRMCQDENVSPDYFDAHHKYAAQLPFLGEFGPVRAVLFQKI